MDAILTVIGSECLDLSLDLNTFVYFGCDPCYYFSSTKIAFAYTLARAEMLILNAY
jgi:hypothetical protein